MPHLNNILTIGNFKGLIPHPNHIDSEYEVVKGKMSIVEYVIQASLDHSCPHCGSKGIRYGFKLVKVKLPNLWRYPCWCFVQKQRYMCKNCNSTYFSKSDITDKGCYISNLTKMFLIKDLKKKTSIQNIAKEHHVSWPTVQRELNKYSFMFSFNYNYLPPVLCFDEFKATNKMSNAKMAFNLVDGINHEIIDICPSRKKAFLIKYFEQYSKEARMNVRHICTDMYKPFISIIKKMFPNAKICVDKFHVVKLFSEALNTCRVETMKNKRETGDTVKYKIYKHYWKLLLKAAYTVDMYKTAWVSFMQTYKTAEYLINEMLEENGVILSTYNVYQDLMITLKLRDPNMLENIIRTNQDNLHPEMKRALKTLRKYKQYLINSMESGYSNGPIEAQNNNIKVLKRIAYGYRNYTNFRNRILMVNTKQIEIPA